MLVSHPLTTSVLEYGLTQRSGFIVLTGSPDLGNTTLLRDVLSEDLAAEVWFININYRTSWAGRGEPRFTDQAGDMVHRLTGGIPRLINQVCGMALIYGYAQQIPYISTQLIVEAARDRLQGGSFRSPTLHSMRPTDTAVRTNAHNW